MKHWRALTFVAILAAGLTACAPPTPTDVRVETFSVSGSSALTVLNRTVRTHGPRIGNSQARAFAAVRVQFLTNFQQQQAGATCRYSPGGQFALRATVSLPDWRQRSRASELERRRWDTISSFAARHEAGHIQIYQRFAQRLTTLYRRARAENCQALEARVKNLSEPMIQELRLENDRFDFIEYRRFVDLLGRLGVTERTG